MVISLERDADLHMAQLMPLPLTVSCFSKIQTGFTFLVPAYLGSPGKRPIKWVFVPYSTLWYGDSVESTVEENSSVFSIIRMRAVKLCTDKILLQFLTGGAG